MKLTHTLLISAILTTLGAASEVTPALTGTVKLAPAAAPAPSTFITSVIATNEHAEPPPVDKGHWTDDAHPRSSSESDSDSSEGGGNHRRALWHPLVVRRDSNAAASKAVTMEPPECDNGCAGGRSEYCRSNPEFCEFLSYECDILGFEKNLCRTD